MTRIFAIGAVLLMPLASMAYPAPDQTTASLTGVSPSQAALSQPASAAPVLLTQGCVLPGTDAVIVLSCAGN